MIPEATFAMLAAAHLGAIHCVVFGGFAPAECAKRIESAEPKIILTASCGIEGGTGGKRRVIPYLPLVSTHTHTHWYFVPRIARAVAKRVTGAGSGREELVEAGGHDPVSAR